MNPKVLFPFSVWYLQELERVGVIVRSRYLSGDNEFQGLCKGCPVRLTLGL